VATGKRRKRFRRREPWPKLAARHGVTDRTLDRWVKAGRIPPPEYINGKKYGDPDSPPALDPDPPINPQHRDPARSNVEAAA
jgi:hypothetical protein